MVSGVVDHAEETVTVLVAATYELIVLCCPAPVPPTIEIMLLLAVLPYKVSLFAPVASILNTMVVDVAVFARPE